jgi:hypothetical protein
MSRAKWILSSVAVLLLAVGSLAAATAAKPETKYKEPAPKTVTVAAGDDGWTTPSGGGTTVDFGDYPIGKIFGTPYKGTRVILKSKPLNPQALGKIDTIVRRPKDIVLKGGKGSGSLEIVALSLEGEKPVSIGGQNYLLHVGLSDTAKSSPGRISLTMRGGDGGTFSSSFPVYPKLTFTPEKGGQAVTIDCGAVPCGKGGKGFTLATNATPWALTGGPGKFDPAALHITTIKSGLRVGGEGSPVYTTAGTSNFYPCIKNTGGQFGPCGPIKHHNHEIELPQ